MKLGAHAYERWLCITALGGKCSNPDCRTKNGCPEDDFDALQMDHIYGDGFRIRDRGGRRICGSQTADFRKARLSGHLHEIYQVLCCNCHSKKTKRGGEHKKRDITDITTPRLPLFDWGKIPSFDERYLKVPND